MTFEQVALPVAQEFGERWEDADIKGQFIRWAIEAFTELYTSGPWPDRVKVVSVTFPAVSNPTTQRAYAQFLAPGPVIAVVGADTKVEYADKFGRPLAYTPAERILMRPDADLYSDVGVPESWFFVGRGMGTGDILGAELSLGVYPAPDPAVGTFLAEVWYLRPAPTGLTASSTFPLADDFIGAVRMGIRWRMLMAEKQFDQAGAFKASYDQERAALVQQWIGGSGVPSRLLAANPRAIHHAPLAAGTGGQ